MNIEQILDSIYVMPVASKKQLISIIKEVKFSKGFLLLKADTVEKKLYFIKKGIARAYSFIEDEEITFWFGKEGEPIISMKSYITQSKSYENVELLEDSLLYELKSDDLQRLFKTDIHIANFGRKFAEKELIKTEERLISRQVRTATERYKELLKNSPDIVQRVPLGHIASYLGITQVSLSRIRAEIK